MDFIDLFQATGDLIVWTRRVVPVTMKVLTWYQSEQIIHLKIHQP